MPMKRELELKMLEFIDDRLAMNGLYLEALKNKDARTLMRLAAQACVGIKESGGNNKGPLVSLIQDTIGGPDHVAWCMSFVQTCIAYAELKTGKESPIFATEHCLTCWRETPVYQRVRILPLAGAIVIWQHGHGDAGHTGIVESCDGENMYCFEANTGGGVDPHGKVVREGDGIYHTHRSMHQIGDMHVLGYLKPF